MHPYRIAILWRGDRDARGAATPQNNRYHRIFEELAALGINVEPAVYNEEFADEVREQLLAVDGVLVWVDPLSRGKNRRALDTLMLDVAACGPWVSAHPDVILKMGVKEVLHRTKHLSWGSDTHLYSTASEFHAAFPSRLQSSGPRVLKQNRGNDGQGVWKVEPAGNPETVRVLHALRGSMPEELSLAAFIARCELYFTDGGLIIDQPFQPRLPEGMIRCYMGVDRVVGFGHQLIKALVAPPPEGPDSPAAQPGPRIMHGPDAADDAASGARCGLAADHLGRRLSLRPAYSVGRGHLRLVRDQCQLGLCDSRRGAGGDRAVDTRQVAGCARATAPISLNRGGCTWLVIPLV